MSVISHKITGLTNDVTQYVRIFPCNPDGLVQSELENQWASADTVSFPSEEPSSYELIDTYTESQTFTAPENGYYQIDVHGASGSGGSGKAGSFYVYDDSEENSFTMYPKAGGGGGGGSGYASSIVKLNKGDLVLIEIGAVGSDTIVTINPTTDELYEVMKVTSGANGGNGSVNNANDLESGISVTAGIGGAGGIATGGNVSNINGGAGGNGTHSTSTSASLAGGTGGSPAHVDGNTGGKGADSGTNQYITPNGVSGSAGFIKIYRGNTNVVA